MQKFIILISFTLSSCSSTTKLEDYVKAGQCAEASRQLIKQRKIEYPQQALTSSAGYAVTYPVVAAGAAVDMVYFVTIVGTGLILSCPHILMSIVLSKNVSSKNSKCFRSSFYPSLFYEKPLSQKIHESTQSLRCLNFTKLSKRTRKVATCFEKRDSDKDLLSSELQLRSIVKNMYHFECMEKAEQQKLAKHYQRLTHKLKERKLEHIEYFWAPEFKLIK